MSMLLMGCGSSAGFSFLPLSQYADSVSGNDSNNGSTIALAKENLTALSVSSDTGIGLVADSQWGQRLSSANKLQVQAVESGAAPIISCFDTLTAGSWTVNATYSTVFEYTLDVSAITPNTSRVVVLVDDAYIIRVTSLANCNSTPGSYYIAENEAGSIGSSSSVTIYYHPSGSTNPTSDGKVVKAITRLNGMQATNGGDYVKGVEFVGNADNNGSVYFSQSAKSTASVAGKPSRIENCIASYGTKHNLLLPSGLIKNCVCYLHDAQLVGTGETTNGIIGIYNTNVAGLSAECRNVHMIATTDAAGIFNGSGSWSQPFTMHSSDGSSYTNWRWYGGSLRGTTQNGGSGGATNCLVDGVFVNRCRQALAPANVNGTGNTSQFKRVLHKLDLGSSLMKLQAIQIDNWAMEDCCWYCTNAASDPVYRMQSVDQTGSINQCVVITGQSSAGERFFLGKLAGSTYAVSINNSVFYTDRQSILDTGVTYTGSRNIFIRRQTATTGIETNENINVTTVNVNTYLTQLGLSTSGTDAEKITRFVDAIFLNGYASVANGDFRLDPNAMDLLEYPDGAKVSDFPIGAQTYWQHGVGVTSGAPSTWPACPTTLAEARTFIANPDGWDYYP